MGLGLCVENFPLLPDNHGAGYEGHEGHGGHEGNEGNEGEEGQRDREGQACESQRLPWRQREDDRWAEEVGPHEEQERQDREQEVKRSRQEGIQVHQSLDRGRAEGEEGAWREGLRGGEEGLCFVQEGKGVLRLSQCQLQRGLREQVAALHSWSFMV